LQRLEGTGHFRVARSTSTVHAIRSQVGHLREVDRSSGCRLCSATPLPSSLCGPICISCRPPTTTWIFFQISNRTKPDQPARLTQNAPAVSGRRRSAFHGARDQIRTGDPHVGNDIRISRTPIRIRNLRISWSRHLARECVLMRVSLYRAERVRATLPATSSTGWRVSECQNPSQSAASGKRENGRFGAPSRSMHQRPSESASEKGKSRLTPLQRPLRRNISSLSHSAYGIIRLRCRLSRYALEGVVCRSLFR